MVGVDTLRKKSLHITDWETIDFLYPEPMQKKKKLNILSV